jgi:predicted esterase
MQPIDENFKEKQHDYTLIFLHGLGDTAEGIMDLFSENPWNPEWVPKTCRIVLPTAPMN